MTIQIGIYQIENLYNATYRIMWRDASIATAIKISESHLSNLLSNYISTHVSRCRQSYLMAFANPEEFLNSPEFCIVSHLEDETTVPGWDFNNDSDAQKWCWSQWIKAYNHCYGTFLTNELTQ